MAETQTPQARNEQTRRDALAFAYKDKDGKLYTIDAKGRRVEAEQNAKILAPRFQEVADRTAAIFMLNTKVVALSPDDRSFLTKLLEGKSTDTSKLSEPQKTALDKLKEMGVSLGIISGELDTTDKIIAGFKSVFAAGGESKELASRLIDQLGGNEMSREDALAMGTAWASSLQVAHEERPQTMDWKHYFSTSGLFSKHFVPYLVGGFLFLLDQVKGMCGLECSNQSLSQFIDREMRGADNRRAAAEIAKFPEIGGRDTREAGQALTRGVQGLDAAGNRIDITPANDDNPFPSATDATGNALPATPEAAGKKREDERQGLFTRLRNEFRRNNFPKTSELIEQAGTGGLLVGGAVAGWGAVQGARGFAEGVTRQEVKHDAAKAKKAEAAHTTATRNVNAAKDAITNFPDEPKPSVVERMRDRFRSDEARTAAAEQRAERHAQAKVEAADKLRAAEAAQDAAKAKMDSTKASHEAFKEGRGKLGVEAAKKIEGGWLKHITWDAPRFIGRGFGHLTGLSLRAASSATTGIASGLASATSGVANWVAKDLGKGAAYLAEAGSGLGKLGEKVGAGALKVVKFGQGIPFAGGLFAAAHTAFASPVNADIVNGKKLSFEDQLRYDFENGKLSRKEYAYYLGLQNLQVMAGFGGFLTAGITETAQNGLEYADPAKMAKYLPESMVEAIKELMGNKKPTGALPADPALSAAVTDVTMQAERARVAAVAAGSPEAMEQARMAANRGLAFARVSGSQYVGTMPTPDATPQVASTLEQLTPFVGA